MATQNPAASRAPGTLPSLDSVSQDLRYAIRNLRRSPGFAILAVLILALGIGANTAIFSLVSSVLLRPLPFGEPDRLVTIWEDLSALGGPNRVQANPATYVEWKARSRSFEDIATLASGTYNLTGQGEPERLFGERATTNLFSVLRMQPLLGRTFAPDDEGPNATPVVVISEDLWLRRFGGDPNLIGRSITLDGLNRTVIGIVPPDFRFPSPETTIWLPAAFTPQELASRDSYYLHVVARLGATTTLDQAQAELTSISQILTQERGMTTPLDARIVPFHEQIAHTARPTLFILLAAVGAVLLITCANVANLLLARATVRRREIALRQALGAERGRVFRQLLTESAVLAVCGVVVGVALSTLSFRYLATLIPATFPGGSSPSLEPTVLAFTAGIALLTVLLFGAGPALIAARLGLSDAFKKGVGSAPARGARMRNGLVVAEITLTVVLLAAAGLLLRSYAAVLATDPGYRHDDLLIAGTALSQTEYATPAARAGFYERVLERVRGLPGVASAGYVNIAPLVFKGGRVLIAIEGRPDPPPEEFASRITSDRVISPDYLETVGVPLIRGRHLDERDAATAPRAVVINDAMARLHWPDTDPLGARIKIGRTSTDAPWYTIVGVVGSIRQNGLDVPPDPELYFAYAQVPVEAPFFWPQHLVVRTVGDPTSFAPAIRSAVWDVDPDQPVSNVRTMNDVFTEELVSRNTQMILVGTFAGLALLLASVGLYGVLSYTVAQRTAEIGVRVALGAQRADVIRGVVRTALVLGAVGIALGIAGALGLTRLLESFLFGVTATDPATFAGVAALLLLVSLVASYVPARRAAGIDPISALRVE
jgi:putative ABC transport system permease protein